METMLGGWKRFEGTADDNSADVTLFCIPGAGFTAADFAPWAQIVSPRVQLLAITPPGRGERSSEPPLSDLNKFAQELTLSISQIADTRPYAIFGHSMGSLVAYEVAAELTARGRPPVALAVSSHPSPTHRKIIDAAVEEILALHERHAFLLCAHKWLGDARLADPEWREAIPESALPILRAEINADGTYKCSKRPLQCRLLVIAGDADVLVVEEDFAGWAQMTQCTDCPEPRKFPGGHQIPKELVPDIASWVSDFVLDAAQAVSFGL